MSFTRKLAFSAVIAGLYAALTLLIPTGFGPLQLRVSEALCLIPFAWAPASWGLFVGCLLANIASPAGALDVIFGSLATLIAARMTARMKNRWLAPLPMAVVNGLIVGAVLAYTGAPDHFGSAFALFAAQIFLSELATGYLLGLPTLAAFMRLSAALGLPVRSFN